MSDVSLEQLKSLKSADDVLPDLIDIYTSQGFTATAWQPGSMAHGKLMAEAEMWAVWHNESVRTVANSLHIDLATGNALDLISINQYDHTPTKAVATRGTFTLTDAESTGPHTIAVGEIVVEDDNGTTYRNLTGGTLNLGSTLETSVEAEIPGTVGNIANGSNLVLNTSISGVTVSNDTTDGTSWITRKGVDKQSEKSIRETCRTKWATLGPNGPKNAYKHWVLTATDGSGDPIGLAKGFVDKPDGNGAFNVYAANETATATAQQVSDLQAFIDARKSPSATPTVVAATEKTIAPPADVVCRRGTKAQVSADITAAVSAYINSLDVGGQVVDDSSVGYVLVSEIVDAAMGVDNVFDFKTSLTDQLIDKSELAVVGTITLNITEI